jgi:hypothetical protein
MHNELVAIIILRVFEKNNFRTCAIVADTSHRTLIIKRPEKKGKKKHPPPSIPKE